jgi:TIR domain
MLYDVFISHAGEDKEDFVRPLVKLLQSHRVEVWYDEFTLTPGMSLRRSIDAGLMKSRFGVVVLSPSFFGKDWPEWELNGLVQRQLSGTRSVILPIWHNVTHREVAQYSLPLADIIAIQSSAGVEDVVDRLLNTIRPTGSALVAARDVLLDRGYEPPVISDDWWLDVIEGAGWQDHRRWCLPVWKMTNDSSSRGEQLAWTVMQYLWQERAEAQPVTQMTPPSEMIEFIEKQPGLLQLALAMPDIVIEHAPQLSIPGFGGPLEEVIERAYQKSIREYEARRTRNDMFGSGLTTDGFCPVCEDCFALRHPTFGNYEPSSVACGFVQGNGAGLGPNIKAFEAVDYLVWLLSRDSEWLPAAHRAYLLEGMKQWAVWPWWGQTNESDYAGEHAGTLCRLLMDTADSKRIRFFKLSPESLIDIRERIDHSRVLLSLSDSTDDLVVAFLEERIPQSWFDAQDRRRIRRNKKQASTSQITSAH